MTQAKLDKFLSDAGGSGHSKYAIQSPRGYELARGELAATVTGETLHELCVEDAKTLVQGTTNEYVVTVASGDGVKQSRFPLRIPGGGQKDEGDAIHKVDVSTAGNMGAVVGHLTRTVVELVRQNTSLALGIVNRDKDYVAQLERSRRAHLNRDTETTIVGKMIDRETEETRAKRETMQGMVKEVVSYLPAVLRQLPGAKEKAIDGLRSSMTDQQLVSMSEVLGPVHMARLMGQSDPMLLAAYFIDELEPEQGRAVIGLLSEAQRRAFLPTLNAFVEARTKEQAAEAAAQAANAPKAAE